MIIGFDSYRFVDVLFCSKTRVVSWFGGMDKIEQVQVADGPSREKNKLC